MTRTIHLMSATLATVTAAATALAADDLVIGSTAPELSVERWVSTPNGAANTGTMGDGRVRVVEFWATWCQPCRMSIPHLTRLQQDWGFEKLEIVGVSVDEEPEDVDGFVTRNADRMRYAVCVDKSKNTANDWMRAADREGIPTAFIVGPNRRIQFIGHPMSEEFEQVLAKVLRGRYDAAKTLEAAPLFERLRTEYDRKNWLQYEATAKEILAIDPRIFVETEIDLIETKLTARDQPEAGYVDAAMFVENKLGSDPEAVIMLAERIALDPDIPDDRRNLDVALAAVQSAGEQFDKPEMKARVLSALASVHLARGELREAVSASRRAYRVAPKRVKNDYRERWVAMKQHASG